jgi:hypothetical protein
LFVEEPDELVGSPADFMLTITACRGIARKCSREVYASFHVMGGPEQQTVKLDGMNPEWQHQHHIQIAKVSRKDIDYFMGKAIKITVFSKRIPVDELKSGKGGAAQADEQRAKGTDVLMAEFRSRGNQFSGGLPAVGLQNGGEGAGNTDHDGVVHAAMRGGAETGARGQRGTLLPVIGHDEGIAIHAEAEQQRQQCSALKRRLARASEKITRVLTLVTEAHKEKNRVLPVHDVEDALKVRTHQFKAIGDDILLSYKAAALKTHLDTVSGGGGGGGAGMKGAGADGSESAACLVM